jgi:hypothetical protein
LVVFFAEGYTGSNCSEGVISSDYSQAGYELGRHAVTAVEADTLTELNSLGTLKWLDKHMRKFITLVPPRRRANFAEGFDKYFEDRGGFE